MLTHVAESHIDYATCVNITHEDYGTPVNIPLLLFLLSVSSRGLS